MDLHLDLIEVRILGSLIEKEITTPEYYPMSLNALTNACNQKSNRDPIMNLSEREVITAIDTLKDKKLCWQFSSASARVPKFEHNFRSLFSFSKEEIAVICVLFLRGPQTIGEIRIRTERMHSFSSLEEVEKTLQLLIERSDGPFVFELPRQPGHKEGRFVHLFSGFPELTAVVESLASTSGQMVLEITKENERLIVLEEGIKALRIEMEDLKKQFLDFKKQLE